VNDSRPCIGPSTRFPSAMTCLRIYLCFLNPRGRSQVTDPLRSRAFNETMGRGTDTKGNSIARPALRFPIVLPGVRNTAGETPGKFLLDFCRGLAHPVSIQTLEGRCLNRSPCSRARSMYSS
jgi:hypothetical protein